MQFSACPGCASEQAAELTVGKGTCRRSCNNHQAASQRERGGFCDEKDNCRLSADGSRSIDAVVEVPHGVRSPFMWPALPKSRPANGDVQDAPLRLFPKRTPAFPQEPCYIPVSGL